MLFPYRLRRFWQVETSSDAPFRGFISRVVYNGELTDKWAERVVTATDPMT